MAKPLVKSLPRGRRKLKKSRQKRVQILSDKGLDVALTPKQLKLLDVLTDAKNQKKTVNEKCELAGICQRQYYNILKTQDFVKALRIRNLTHAVATSHFIVKRVCDDALNGKYQQQLLALRLSGDYQDKEQPLFQINFNNRENENIDDLLSSYFSKPHSKAPVIDVDANNT